MAAMTLVVPLRGQAAAAPAAPPKAAAAAPAKAAVAADFLEYLATFEGEEENWTDFEALADEPPAAPAKPANPKAVKPGEPE